MNKPSLILLTILCLTPSLWGQNDTVKYVDNESCGCELVFINGIQTTESNGRYGFKLEDGTQIVENKYMYVDKFHGNYCKVYIDDYHCGLINRDGDEIVPCIYEGLNYPSDSMILVTQNGLHGYTNLEGELVIPCQYRAASGFSEGMAVVSIDIDSFTVYYGFIDKKGNLAIRPEYEYAYPFNEGVAVVKQYDRYGMIDKNGKTTLTIKYEFVSSMNDGRFFAADNGAIAMFDSNYHQMTPFLYHDILAHNEDVYLVMRDRKYGYLNEQGEEYIKCEYDMAGPIINGFATIMKEQKYGIIRKDGNVILPTEFDHSGLREEAYVFHDGRALVEKNGRFGYVDTTGTIVVPIFYDDAYQYSEGLAPIKSNGMWGYIDSEGYLFIPFVFQYASPFLHGRAEVVYNGTTHKMNSKGECVKNCKEAPKSWRQ